MPLRPMNIDGRLLEAEAELVSLDMPPGRSGSLNEDQRDTI